MVALMKTDEKNADVYISFRSSEVFLFPTIDVTTYCKLGQYL